MRAGIVVTGTEVLTGAVADRNGPWVSTQLADLGVDVAGITICGDRPDDLTAQLRFFADSGVDLIVTSGGLGPTADDLTVATVAHACELPIAVDEPMAAHIADIIAQWSTSRSSDLDQETVREATRKQAMRPAGAEFVAPTGTAPGVAIAATDRHPAILILPGPPSELQAMWPHAITAGPIADALAERTDIRVETLRMFGVAESELAKTLRNAQPRIPGFTDMEITTCLRRGEVEVVTRFAPAAAESYIELVAALADVHGEKIFSVDGSTIDDVIANLLGTQLLATAESCTGGMIAARLTDRPGSSAYVSGGVVSYSNDAKHELLGVPAELIDTHGAVSEEVVAAMARGAIDRFHAFVGVATSGIAGPGGATPDKPVGTVCFGIAFAEGTTHTVTRIVPGDRAAVRERSVTIALHLLRKHLLAVAQ